MKIFKQKSLWDVYKSSTRNFTKPVFNRIIFWLSLLLALTMVTWVAVQGHNNYTVSESAQFVHGIVEVAFNFTLSILGFLIAGFAIFASVTKAELFIMLAQIPYKKNGKETNISRLQFIFFNFLNVFTIILSLMAFSIFITLGFSENSPLTKASYFIASYNHKIAIVTNFAVAGVLIVWLTNAILKLKSFIWNLYQAVILSITTESELDSHHKNFRKKST